MKINPKFFRPVEVSSLLGNAQKAAENLGWKPKIDRYGSFFASLSFLPVIGDVILVALGYFRAKFWLTAFWMLVGKLCRYMSVYGTTLLV